MTNIENSSRKGSKKHMSIRIDMTPMVDLGFLLITFFIFTSALTESNAMKLYMPKDGPETEVSDKNVLTVLVDETFTLTVYEGDWKTASNHQKIVATGYGPSGLGKLINDKKERMLKEDPSDKLFVVIKPVATAEYRNIINVLDEMTIYQVPSYAITEPTPEETSFISVSKLNNYGLKTK
jgi:biopolymer transport protein ExbD